MTLKRPTLVIIASAVLVAAAALCSLAGNGSARAEAAAPQGADPKDGQLKALIQETCSNCHDASVVEGVMKSPAGWAQTIDDMRGRGAQITDEQAEMIIQYLARTQPAEG